MSSSASFIGSGFYVAGASQYAPGTVRVKYSSAPKAISSVGVNDALNPVNYVLSGPGAYSIVSIQPVSGDPLSFDIILASSLTVGTWTVQVSNVQTTASNPLTAPTAAQFQVISSASLMPLSGGAEDDDPETIIRKHLSPALRGPTWDALIKALSVGDDINWTNARAAFDQLYLSTASGSYLERKAGDQGLIKPLNVGMDDELFRKLAIKTSANKVVHEAIREILEVYFGQDSLRAFVEADLDEKYNLSGSVDLTWTLDEKETFSHTFVGSEFGSVSAAKAIEVAFALTKVMRDAGSRGFAAVYQSPLTGGNRVRIYSGSLGLGSFVRVTGGSAQNVLQFPTLIGTYSGTISTGTGYTWSYTHPDSDTTRASLTINTGTTAVLFDISLVQVGDYVIMGTDAQTGVTGTYTIKAVSVTWSGALLTQSFDIQRLTFNSTAIQASNAAYTFYRPTKNSIAAAGGRTVVVAQTKNGQVDISIPATTQVVSRGPNQALYGRLNSSFDIIRLIRDAAGVTTITTALPHGLTTGNQVWIDDFMPAPSIPYITPGNSATFPSSFRYAASKAGIIAESQVPSSPVTEDARVTTLSNGQFLFCGGFTRAAGPITNSTGFWSSGAGTTRVACNRYVSGSTSTITDATEADGATQSGHTWVATSDLNSAREHHAVSAYDTGAIASGGMAESPIAVLASAEQYLLDSIWVNLPDMSSPRAGHQQVTLPNGNVMVIGGATTEGTALATTEIYNGVSWSAGPTMNKPRTDFQAVWLSNGKLMVIGGRTMGEGHTSDAQTLGLWRMDETTGTASADATGNYPLTAIGASLDGNGATITTQGKVNACRDFNTSGTYLTGAGNATAVTKLLGEWTLECWFKRTTINQPQNFASYGGATNSAADNLLLNAGIDTTNHLFWMWETGTGTDVTATTTATVESLPSYRADYFNHLAVRKAFHLPKLVVSASRASNVTTLVFSAAHGFSNSDVIYFASGDSLFGSGAKTITASTTTSISFAETGSDIGFRLMGGYVAKTFDVTIFINGVQIQAWTNQANSTGGTSGAWYIAHQPEIPSSGFQGFLDDVRVSSTARSDEEIRGNFLKGWGHQKSHVDADRAVGAVTDTCEIYDGVSWAMTGRMSIGRAFHQAIVVPGGLNDGFGNDYVLVHGGLGCDITQVPPINYPATIGLWPNNSLRDTEVYDASVGRWSPVKASGVRRHGHSMTYLPTSGQVVVHGGQSLNQNIADVDDAGYPEILDVATRTWKTAPVKYRTPVGTFCATPTASLREVVLYGGFDQTGATNTKALTYIDGDHMVSGSGINGQHVVTATPSSTTLQIQTAKTTGERGYTSSMGSRYLGDDGTWNQARVNGTWKISTGSRSSSKTTLVLSFPTGYLAHDISVGDYVYVNSRTSQFGGGLKLVTAVTSTSITYVEAASNQSSISVTGSVSENWSPNAGLAPVAATAQPVNDPGPYFFDPLAGLAITSTESTVTNFPLYANQNYEEVELDDVSGSGSKFPDSNGYIVFNFGTDAQTQPIKYLGRYKSSPSTVRLTLDYSYRFVADQAVGAKVTLLSQREPYAPTSAVGSSYVTASSAGRAAAAAAAEEAMAAGVTPVVTIVYPGDRGLGGEGYPSHGAQKLSDKVGIFAGDDITLEVQEDREK